MTTPGACVSDGGGQLEENEGVNPLLHNADAIFPYSIGKYIAEKDHSARPTDAAGHVCKPRKGQNTYGCDSHGTMVLHSINGTAPTSGSGLKRVINPNFTPLFVRTLFDVVRYDGGTADHIPAYLEPIFGANGWACTSSASKHDLLNYGFIILSSCGRTH